MTKVKKMNFKRKILTIGSALALSLTLGTSAFAEVADTKTNNIGINIKSGEFSILTSEVEPFGDITLQSTPTTHKTSFTSKFTVKDLSGVQAGWRVDVSASPFDNGIDQLPLGSLSLKPVSNIQRVGTGEGDFPIISQSSNIIIDDGNIEVARAVEGSGMGVFDLTFPQEALSITIDPTIVKLNTGNDTYESILTWDLVQAP